MCLTASIGKLIGLYVKVVTMLVSNKFAFIFWVMIVFGGSGDLVHGVVFVDIRY